MTLEESYPKLKEGGGFEILRRGPNPSELTLIPPPPSGYTVKFLRDSAGLGQAIAFVRPLQCNLNWEAIKPVSDHSQVGNQRIIWYLLRIFFKGWRELAREMKTAPNDPSPSFLWALWKRFTCVTSFIIHSKYFPVSGWLNTHNSP